MKKVLCGIFLAAAAAYAKPVSPFIRQAKGRPVLVVNGDNDHYFKSACMRNFVPAEERVASPEGARRYLDAIAAGAVGVYTFNAAYLPDEMQRLIYGKGLGADVVGKLPPAVSLNGFKPKRPPLRDQDLAKFGAVSHKVLSAWRTPFPPEALREGMNEVRVSASEGRFRTVW